MTKQHVIAKKAKPGKAKKEEEKKNRLEND